MRNGQIESDLPRCATCKKMLRAGIVVRAAPAVFEGEGLFVASNAEIYWPLCRACARKSGYCG